MELLPARKPFIKFTPGLRVWHKRREQWATVTESGAPDTVMVVFDDDKDSDAEVSRGQLALGMPPTTQSGALITCDGCGRSFPYITELMVIPAPTEIAVANYGTTEIVFIVCEPVDGVAVCYDKALAAEIEYNEKRCRIPGCDGTDCLSASIRHLSMKYAR